MLTLDFDLDVDDAIKRIPNRQQRHNTLVAVLNRGRFVVQRSIMQRAREHTKTGTMLRGFTTALDEPGERATVSNSVGYTGYVDQPTQPHEITARNVEFLRFVPGADAGPSTTRLTGVARSGQESLYVYKRSVHHPGFRGAFFFRDGLEDSLRDFQTIMQDEVNKLAQGNPAG